MQIRNCFVFVHFQITAADIQKCLSPPRPGMYSECFSTPKLICTAPKSERIKKNLYIIFAVYYCFIRINSVIHAWFFWISYLSFVCVCSTCHGSNATRFIHCLCLFLSFAVVDFLFSISHPLQQHYPHWKRDNQFYIFLFSCYFYDSTAIRLVVAAYFTDFFFSLSSFLFVSHHSFALCIYMSLRLSKLRLPEENNCKDEIAMFALVIRLHENPESVWIVELLHSSIKTEVARHNGARGRERRKERERGR